jgi:hypothetical protein
VSTWHLNTFVCYAQQYISRVTSEYKLPLEDTLGRAHNLSSVRLFTDDKNPQHMMMAESIANETEVHGNCTSDRGLQRGAVQCVKASARSEVKV